MSVESSPTDATARTTATESDATGTAVVPTEGPSDGGVDATLWIAIGSAVAGSLAIILVVVAVYRSRQPSSKSVTSSDQIYICLLVGRNVSLVNSADRPQLCN